MKIIKEEIIIKTITMKFVKDQFDKLTDKKGELTWEMFFLKSANIK